nr:DUF309 domain-containing protein [Mesorhizobium sp. SEMIA 3007]
MRAKQVFSGSYSWEAHEALETLWHAAKQSAQHAFSSRDSSCWRRPG